ncbi:NAC domain-containing protein 72-like [Tasmannia lanceolata]|uniref:NAC domain-containing protein 72-like n=1 Tax=Tasmannia lanceolata TaxID=3420 RepID=UPI004062DA28
MTAGICVMTTAISNNTLAVTLGAVTTTENYESGGENKWYSFTSRQQRKYQGGDHSNRKAGHGFWKARKENRDVIHDGKVYGKKQSLVYYRENTPKATKTNWLMQEYTIPEWTKKKKDHPGSNMMLDDCVLCKVYRSFRGTDKPAKLNQGKLSK